MQYMSAIEVARRLNIHPSTLNKRCARGIIKGVKGVDKVYPQAWYVDWEEVQRYFRERREKWKKPRRECKPLSVGDLAYMAGLLEGEGCFTAFLTRAKSRKYESWSTRYFIQIIMANPEPIMWLKEVTGIGYTFQRKREKEGYLDLWGWRADSHVACAIIEKILPYLKFKDKQARLFLELERRVIEGKDYRRGGTNTTGISHEEYQERQKIVEQIQALNKRTGKVRRKEFSSVQ